MQNLSASLGLGDQDIRFLGFRSDVPDLHAASDFFVLPSVTEGLPLSVLEAMSAGNPVIATPVGGIPELVENGRHGLLIPVGDDRALTEAIARIAESKSLRRALGQAGLDRVEHDFSFFQMTERYESLYADLAGIRTANN
jgi:glycosyltransferase involved in cell wall biosynthesis